MVPSPGLPHPETHGRLDTPFFRVGLERSGFAENHAENEAPSLNSALPLHLPALKRLKATNNAALWNELQTPH